MTISENATARGMQNQFLVTKFQYLSWGKFNGQLNIQSNAGQKWSLFFCQGRLAWATGGSHSTRLWQRHLIKNCPEIATSFMGFRESDDLNGWQYQALTVLVKLQQITQKQVVAIIAGTISEVLFDIIQQIPIQQLSYTSNEQCLREPPLTLIDTELALKQALQAWKSWQDAGLAKVSPNLAPVLRQPEQLQQQSTAAAYQNFVTLINGSNTLRDLAGRMKQDLLLLTRSLIAYIRKGIIGLVEVADLPLVTDTDKIASSAIPTLTGKAKGARPLIACVDDSPQTCQMMEQIFTKAGFQFVSIQNSMEALPILIERQPDLIFLDLMMPVVNGYEICSQLRRVSLFANTPMIILTGSDGLIDRVRAKVVGASEFVAKPVESQKVLGVVRKYLSAPAGAMKTSNIQFTQPTLQM